MAATFLSLFFCFCFVFQFWIHSFQSHDWLTHGLSSRIKISPVPNQDHSSVHGKKATIQGETTHFGDSWSIFSPSNCPTAPVWWHLHVSCRESFTSHCCLNKSFQLQTCKAGLFKVCSHVAAIIYAILAAVNKQSTAIYISQSHKSHLKAIYVMGWIPYYIQKVCDQTI